MIKNLIAKAAKKTPTPYTTPWTISYNGQTLTPLDDTDNVIEQFEYALDVSHGRPVTLQHKADTITVTEATMKAGFAFIHSH